MTVHQIADSFAYWTPLVTSDSSHKSLHSGLRSSNILASPAHWVLGAPASRFRGAIEMCPLRFIRHAILCVFLHS